MKIQLGCYVTVLLSGLIAFFPSTFSDQISARIIDNSSVHTIKIISQVYISKKIIAHRKIFSQIKQVAQFEENVSLQHIVWSPNGKYLAIASDGSSIVKVIEIANNTKVLERNYQEPSQISSLAWSPNSRNLAVDGLGQLLDSGEEFDEIELFDIPTGERVSKVQHSNEIAEISWSPDGQYFASIDFGNIDAGGLGSKLRIFEPLTGEEILQVSHDKFLLDAQWSPNGQYVATASRDRKAKIVDISRRNVIFELVHAHSVRGISWSPDSQYIATSSLLGSKIMNLLSGQLVPFINEQVQEVVWSPDGQYIATSTLPESKNISDINIFEFSTGRKIAYVDHAQTRVKSKQWSPNSRYLMTAGYDKTMRLMDIQRGREILKLIYDYVTQDFDWSPDGQYVVIASGNSAKILSIPSRLEVASIDHDGLVTNVLWSPDGRYVASANSSPRPIVKVLQVHN
ncbi:MAG: hypothetical protein F6J87_20520 [Spirulina sp. SIO3F2]|nr:hypothetical protein [Spirulina sp. SIO3F2]